MAFKLKNLIIKKVDLVKEGANPEAHVNLFKSKGGEIGITKTADTFADKIKSEALYDVFRQIWMYCDAISGSLIEILKDEETADKAEAMNKSLEQFYGAACLAVDRWSEGKTSDFVVGEPVGNEASNIIEGFVIKKMTENLEESLNKSLDGLSVMIEKNDNEEGGQIIMKYNFDETRLTDEEKAQLSAIAKKAGIDENKDSESEPDPAHAGDGAGGSVVKSKPAAEPGTEKDNMSSDDIYKGMHPLVAAELEELKKYRIRKEEEKLTAIAKKYEPLGKKQEELVPMLKSVKAAGGTAYNDMIAMLDTSLESFNKSSAFTEIGSNGHGAATPVAKSKIESAAKEISSANPDMTQEQAMLKAVMDNPELYDEYVKGV